MQFRDIVDQPVLGIMASSAIRSDGLAVHVRMAGNTLGAGFGKYERSMAGPAINGLVPTGQREFCFVMVEMERIF